jgi:hypothetical protein
MIGFANGGDDVGWGAVFDSVEDVLIFGWVEFLDAKAGSAEVGGLRVDAIRSWSG